MARIGREEGLYLHARKAYNDGGVAGNTNSRFAYAPALDEPLTSLKECTHCLEESSLPLWDAYTDLLGEPQVRTGHRVPETDVAFESLELTTEVENAFHNLSTKENGKCGVHCSWHGMTPYY